MNLRALRHSLIARLLGGALLVLVLVQLAGFILVRQSIERNAREQISREFDIGEKVWLRLLDQNAERLRQSAALLAADYGFRSAVSSADQETIASALENNGQRVGAAVAALFDTEFHVRAISTGLSSQELSPLLSAMGPELQAHARDGRIIIFDGQPYQLVMVPLRAPLIVGWVLMGFPVGPELANEMDRLLQIHLAIETQRPDGRHAVPVSTLKPALRDRIEASGAGETEEDGETFLVRSMPMPAIGGQARVLLVRSVNDVVAPYQQLQVLLAVISVGGVLLIAFASGFMARQLARPWQALLEATRRLSRGDYSVALDVVAREDEIGTLAQSFDHMRVDIAAQQDEIRRLAYWDRLTGLPNRENFREAVQQAINRQSEAAGAGQPAHPVSVLTLDLDRFKHVNDVLGYVVGDQLLKTVAVMLDLQMRGRSGLVARLGGNEFALLLATGGADEALTLAQQVMRVMEQPMALDEQTVDLSAGIGFACWPEDAPDVDLLLSRSEIAMYVAKRQLEGAVRYNPGLDSGSTQTLSLLTDLRRALERGELRLYLQPKVSLRGDGAYSAEALVRWQHPQRGLVPPLSFIPFAEQTGYIRKVTLWMFGECARFLATADPTLRLSVNLSTRDLLDLELSQRLGEILARHGVAAQRFCLEITESAIMDDPQRAEAVLNRLSAQGFKLSIDDFGTGYSSLAYLKRLPVNELKIDKSFVMGMATDEDDEIIVRSTIDLAHNLGLTVVAEGVETGAIQDRLADLGCDDAQGYHISRPMHAPEFTNWLQRVK